MKSKYYAGVKKAIDDFWRENKYPPTLRDIMKIVGIPSTSVCRWVVRRTDGIRISKNGRIIPDWVDAIFNENNGKSK